MKSYLSSLLIVFLALEFSQNSFAEEDVSLLKKECNDKNTNSCLALSKIYREGIILPKDPHLKLEYLQKACDLGDGKGCSNIGVHIINNNPTDKELERAINLFDKACNLKEPIGCYNLANLYESNKRSKFNMEEANLALKRACDLEYFKACVELANNYMLGNGV